MSIYLARKTHLTLLLTKKVTVPNKYSDFVDVFSEKSANVFSKRTGINKYTIKLEENKQSPHEPIDSLGPVQLETFKIYI